MHDILVLISIEKHLGPNAPIDELDANGCTPLMYAAMADSHLAVEMLLNFSARREQVCMLASVCVCVCVCVCV